jgi:hypothetical protein
MAMKKENNLTFKALAGTLLALLIALGSFILVDASFPVRHWEPHYRAAELMQNIFFVHAAISTLMLLFSLYLLFIYFRDYLQLKSRFTLGLLIAVFSFMLFAITANPLLHLFFGVYGNRGIFMLIPYVFATISLALLVWVSSK